MIDYRWGWMLLGNVPIGVGDDDTTNSADVKPPSMRLVLWGLALLIVSHRQLLRLYRYDKK